MQVLSFIGPLLSAFGIGMDAKNGMDAYKTQKKMAELNFQMQSDAINQQRQASTMQAAINSQLASSEKAALERNASVLEQQAGVVTSVGRENARRTREDFARMLATQRSSLAKSGLLDTTGSPLQMLAATAEQEQRAVDEQNYQTESQRRGLFREADNQRTEGDLASIGILDAQARGGAASLQAQNALTQSTMTLQKEMEAVQAMKRSTLQRVMDGFSALTGRATTNAQNTGSWTGYNPRTAARY